MGKKTVAKRNKVKPFIKVRISSFSLYWTHASRRGLRNSAIWRSKM
jgi:hypothetical protein